MLIHAKHRWTEVIQPCLWTFALKQVEFNLNNLRLGKSRKSRAKTFSAMHKKINIRHYHTFGCPVYVLDARLQGDGFIPKWDEQVRVGAYARISPIHKVNVSLILDISTGHFSPQFHVVFNETFSTVPSLKNVSIPASWTFICENNRELDTYEDFNLADLWRKSKQENGVKFDIQRDSNNKKFQEPKDDELTNCDTEHVTKNLFTNVLQKSKSYLDVAKGSFADSDNNKTFPTRSTLYQGFVENEGERTAESHASKL